MRVAFLNRRRDSHAGGDLVEVDATMAALSKLGIECEYAPEGWTLDWLQTFDLAHVFHINFGWSTYNWQRCIEARVRYVLTPIFYPDTSLGADRDTIREGLYRASYLLPNSNSEYEELLDVLHIKGTEAYDYPARLPVPNGTDPLFHGECSPEQRNGVLCVTPRVGEKNTDVVKRACEQLAVRFECVSGVADREELANVYRRALVFVNASLSERMSLTTGEALAAGCRVIDTAGNRGGEWYGHQHVRIDPTDAELLRAAIWIACDPTREWNYAPNRLAQRLTWDRVAQQLLRVYRRALS